MYPFDPDAKSRLAKLLTEMRMYRRISQLQLADNAGVNASVVNRAERRGNAKIQTWEKLFLALGYQLTFDVQELAEEYHDLLVAEADRRRERLEEGLQTGKHRFYG